MGGARRLGLTIVVAALVQSACSSDYTAEAEQERDAELARYVGDGDPLLGFLPGGSDYDAFFASDASPPVYTLAWCRSAPSSLAK